MDHDNDPAKEESCFDYYCCYAMDGLAEEERWTREESSDVVPFWSGNYQRNP